MLTAFLGATIALVQTDLKKTLAYSTISQLGLHDCRGRPWRVWGSHVPPDHPRLLQGALFLGAGSVMHATDGVLDMRRLGGLRHKMPTTYVPFLIGAAALAGIIPLAGFFSKDAILVGTLGASTCFSMYRRGHGPVDRVLQFSHGFPDLSRAAARRRICPHMSMKARGS